MPWFRSEIPQDNIHHLIGNPMPNVVRHAYKHVEGIQTIDLHITLSISV